MTLTGTAFQNVTRVTIGGRTVAFRALNASSLPGHPEGHRPGQGRHHRHHPRRHQHYGNDLHLHLSRSDVADGGPQG
jgi:hypothetical protein